MVVLNDNGMSINENVGGVARLLRRARTRPGYLRFKRTYRRVMKKHPHAYEELHRLKERIKAHLLPSGIFDDLGFYYIGPVDGHDEKALETTLRWAKDLHRPVVVHVVTVKGKGYAPAEADPQTYHGVNPFDPEDRRHDRSGQRFFCGIRCIGDCACGKGPDGMRRYRGDGTRHGAVRICPPFSEPLF